MIFSWLLLKKLMLTIDNLKKRGWQIPGIYYMRFTTEKSVDYLFRECEKVAEIKIYIYIRHNIETSALV
jgi:hypothetical protein